MRTIAPVSTIFVKTTTTYKIQPYSVDPNFEVRPWNTPLNPPWGKFSSPPLQGELEGVKLDPLSITYKLGSFGFQGVSGLNP